MFLGFLKSLKQQIPREFDSNYAGDRITPLHGSILIWELMKFHDKYEKVNDFLDVLKSLDMNCEEFNFGIFTLRNGMYLRALADGLMEVEKLYSNNLGKIERAILFNEGVPELAVTDPNHQFGGSYYFVSNVHTTYSKILQIINIIVANNLHGCQILDLCVKFKHFLPEEIFCLLFRFLNKPLLKQITSWIVFGKLEDPREEFFIRHVDSVKPTVVEQSEISCVSEQTRSEDIMENIFKIDNNYLPMHMSFSLASKILNTGKLVSLLRHGPSNAENLNEFQNGDFGLNEEDIVKKMKDLEQADNFYLTSVEKVVHFVWNSVNKIK